MVPKHPFVYPGAGDITRHVSFVAMPVWEVFGEKFRVPAEGVYEYVVATINAARQKLSI
jgi:hypothetical protein